MRLQAGMNGLPVGLTALLLACAPLLVPLEAVPNAGSNGNITDPHRDVHDHVLTVGGNGDGLIAPVAPLVQPGHAQHDPLPPAETHMLNELDASSSTPPLKAPLAAAYIGHPLAPNAMEIRQQIIDNLVLAIEVMLLLLLLSVCCLIYLSKKVDRLKSAIRFSLWKRR